ncbi:unnamed protein product [Urochloa humidicola]
MLASFMQQQQARPPQQLGAYYHQQQPGAHYQPMQQLQMPPSVPAPAQSWTPWSGGSWDQSALANNFSTMTLTPLSSTEWTVDSGASTHMMPDIGSSNQERDCQVQ